MKIRLIPVVALANRCPTSTSLNNAGQEDRLKAGVVQNAMQDTVNEGGGKFENAPQTFRAKGVRFWNRGVTTEWVA